MPLKHSVQGLKKLLPHGQGERSSNSRTRDRRRISHSDARDTLPSAQWLSYSGKDHRDKPDGYIEHEEQRREVEAKLGAQRAARRVLGLLQPPQQQHLEYHGTPLVRSRPGTTEQFTELPAGPQNIPGETFSRELKDVDDQRDLQLQVQHPNDLEDASDSEVEFEAQEPTPEIPPRDHTLSADTGDEPDANASQSVDKGSVASPIHRNAVDNKFSVSSDILPPLGSSGDSKSSTTFQYWDSSVYDAKQPEGAAHGEISPRSQTWSGSTHGPDRGYSAVNKAPGPNEQESRGASNLRAWMMMSPDDRDRKELSIAEKGNKDLPPLPLRSFDRADSKYSIPKSSAVNRAKLDIQSEEDFAKIFNRRLFNELPRSTIKELKDCYNKVSKFSMTLAFDILRPYIEIRPALENEASDLKKKIESFEDELKSRVTAYESMLVEQSLELKAEKKKAIGELVRTHKTAMDSQSKEHEEVLAEHNKEVAKLTKERSQANAEVNEKRHNLELLEYKIAQKEADLESLRKSIERRDGQIRSYEDTIVRNEVLIGQQQKDLASKAQAIEKYVVELTKLCTENDEKVKRIKAKAARERAEQESDKEAAMSSAWKTMNEEMSRQEAEHQAVVTALQADLERQRKSAEEGLGRKTAEHLASVQKIQDDHAGAKRKWIHDMEELKRSANQALDDKLAEHAATVQSLKNDHAAITEKMQHDIDEAEDAVTAKTAERDAVVHQLQKEHEVAIMKLKRANQEALKQLEEDHHFATAKIYQDRQEANAALLNRDNNEKFQATLFQTGNLPRKTDAQIRDSIVGVQQLVESLGRSAWKKDQPAWTQQLLQRAGKDNAAREFRRAVLQDAIWATLFKHVFESPFRIFGDAGRDLEQQWVEHSGEGTDASQSIICTAVLTLPTRLFRWTGLRVASTRYQRRTLAVFHLEERS